MVISALRAQVCPPGVSSACPSQWLQRGLSALKTSAAEKGDSLTCLALGHNAGQPVGWWHFHTRRQTVEWEKALRVLG